MLVDLFDLVQAPGTESLSFVIITEGKLLSGGPSLSSLKSYCEIRTLSSSSILDTYLLSCFIPFLRRGEHLPASLKED